MVCVCVFRWACTCECRYLWKPEAFDSPDLELQTIMSYLIQVLGNKLRFFGNVANDLNSWAITPVQIGSTFDAPKMTRMYPYEDQEYKKPELLLDKVDSWPKTPVEVQSQPGLLCQQTYISQAADRVCLLLLISPWAVYLPSTSPSGFYNGTETAIMASEHDLESGKSDPSTGRLGQVSKTKYAWSLTQARAK